VDADLSPGAQHGTVGADPVAYVVMNQACCCGRADRSDSVPQAVARAVAVDNLAKLTLQVAATGAPLVPIPEEDYQELPDLGGSLNDDTVWRHLLARLPADGIRR
jgi:3,4-dihydroxyphthalate decarboxylase